MAKSRQKQGLKKLQPLNQENYTGWNTHLCFFFFLRDTPVYLNEIAIIQAESYSYHLEVSTNRTWALRVYWNERKYLRNKGSYRWAGPNICKQTPLKFLTDLKVHIRRGDSKYPGESNSWKSWKSEQGFQLLPMVMKTVWSLSHTKVKRCGKYLRIFFESTEELYFRSKNYVPRPRDSL